MFTQIVRLAHGKPKRSMKVEIIDKPTGLELEVTKKVDALIGQFKAIDWSSRGLGIETSHALEGVRCNGSSELNTVIDVLYQIDGKGTDDDIIEPSYSKKLSKCLKDITHNMQITLSIQKEIARLNICPRCEGKKHEKGKCKNGVSRKDERCWQDCVKCHGRGFTNV